MRKLAVFMLIFAVGFIIFALNHPEKSFPWSNSISYIIYLIYFILMIILFTSFKKK